MKKSTKIIIAVIAAIIIIAIIVMAFIMNNKTEKNQNTQLPEVNNAEDLSTLLDKIYDGIKTDIFNVETRTIDLEDTTSVKSYTGLEDAQNLEYAVASEPMISSQAYSLILAKVKEGTNPSEIAKEMSENINMRKWICVSAEKLYATNSGNIVFLVMTNEEMATSVYESFKSLAGNLGEVYEKVAEEEELPEDMSFPIPQ